MVIQPSFFGRFSNAIVCTWFSIPRRWRVKTLFSLVPAGVSRLVIIMWDPSTLLVGLMLLNIAGYLLKEIWIKQATHLEALQHY